MSLSPLSAADLYDPDDDIEGFDDFPETSLDDEDYDEFLSREFDREGRTRGEPPVGRYIGLAIVLLAALAIVLFW